MREYQSVRIRGPLEIAELVLARFCEVVAQHETIIEFVLAFRRAAWCGQIRHTEDLCGCYTPGRRNQVQVAWHLAFGVPKKDDLRAVR